MPEISKAELRRLRRAASYGEQARAREAQVQRLRRENRSRQRTEVQGVGPQTERAFRAQAASAGWEASKRGWPDFILRRGNEVAFVEVKSRDGIALKTDQTKVAELLAAAGFKVYRWSPDGGFVRIQVASRTEQTPGGSTTTTEPATRGRCTAGALLHSETGSTSSSAHEPAQRRVSQGTRTPEGTGPEYDYGPQEWRPQEGRMVASWVTRSKL